jgi:hypothetical protein
MAPFGDLLHRLNLEFFRITLAAHDSSFMPQFKASECLQVQGRFKPPHS